MTCLSWLLFCQFFIHFVCCLIRFGCFLGGLGGGINASSGSCGGRVRGGGIPMTEWNEAPSTGGGVDGGGGGGGGGREGGVRGWLLIPGISGNEKTSWSSFLDGGFFEIRLTLLPVLGSFVFLLINDSRIRWKDFWFSKQLLLAWSMSWLELVSLNTSLEASFETISS